MKGFQLNVLLRKWFVCGVSLTSGQLLKKSTEKFHNNVLLSFGIPRHAPEYTHYDPSYMEEVRLFST